MYNSCKLCEPLSGLVKAETRIYFETIEEAAIHANFHFRQCQLISDVDGIPESEIFKRCFPMKLESVNEINNCSNRKRSATTTSPKYRLDGNENK